MLTFDQCIDFCGLTEEEVDLLARHEGVPNIVAAELGSELLKTTEGRAQLAYILRNCANCAAECGNLEEAASCFKTYTLFRERLIS
jgi:hypothetical protein